MDRHTEDHSEAGLGAPQSPPYEDWLKMEFRENFTQLRDYDAKILDLLKFYVGVVLSVVGVCATLLGLTALDAKQQHIGILLLATAVLGEMIFVWLIALRRYFVRSARQLNAIRAVYSSVLSFELRKSITQPTDPAYPTVVHPGSAHMLIVKLVTYVNAVVAAAGAAMATGGGLAAVPWWLPIAVGVVALAAVTAFNLGCILGKVKDGNGDA